MSKLAEKTVSELLEIIEQQRKLISCLRGTIEQQQETIQDYHYQESMTNVDC